MEDPSRREAKAQVSVDLDADVFAELQRRATPLVDTVNDVLRRLLANPDPPVDAAPTPPPVTRGPRTGRRGRLAGLVGVGAVQAGDLVRHRRKRTGETFEATITTDGCLTVEGVAEPFVAPSPALRHFTGSEIDGWHHWTHVPSGRTLRELRFEVDG
jgi:hypothetical protein